MPSYYTKIIQEHCYYNKDEILASKFVGCYNCKNVCSVNDIIDFVDRENTALCPVCLNDSCVGDASQLDVTKEWFLNLLHDSNKPAEEFPIKKSNKENEKQDMWKILKTRISSVFAFKNGVEK